MAINVAKEVSTMHRMTVKDLRRKFVEVFGDETRSGNKAWLIKRIAWRMQANAEGGLSERARQKAHELACDADIRLSPPKIKTAAAPAAEPATECVSAYPGTQHLERPVPVGRVVLIPGIFMAALR
jgi:hypothetical protein